MKTRIKEVRKRMKETQETFAQKLALSQNFVWMMEKGQREASERTIRDICRIYKVSYRWLTTGEGEMFEDDTNEVMAIIDSIMMGEDSMAKKTLTAFASLSDEHWLLLEEIINKLK